MDPLLKVIDKYMNKIWDKETELLGTVTRSLRKISNLSQEELADRAGVSPEDVQRIESGEFVGSGGERLSKLANFNKLLRYLQDDRGDAHELINSMEEAIVVHGRSIGLSYKELADWAGVSLARSLRISQRSERISSDSCVASIRSAGNGQEISSISFLATPNDEITRRLIKKLEAYVTILTEPLQR